MCGGERQDLTGEKDKDSLRRGASPVSLCGEERLWRRQNNLEECRKRQKDIRRDRVIQKIKKEAELQVCDRGAVLEAKQIQNYPYPLSVLIEILNSCITIAKIVVTHNVFMLASN